jgi:23S rRNA (guanosine2251-2'-O)-methyltransferase
MNKEDYIYGRNSVIEILTQNPGRVNKILISQTANKDGRINDIISLAKAGRIVFQFVPKEKFKDLSALAHQGVLAYVSPVEYTDIDEFLSRKKEDYSRIVILDGVEDAGNFGAIARTAVCAGYDAIIIPSRRNAQINAAVNKISAGAINRISVIKVNSLQSTIDKLKDNDYWIIAADAKGKDNYFDINYTEINFALILGGEETGVSKNNIKNSDFTIRIPLLRNFNSLNVSAAAAAIIYETVRQQITKYGV